MQLRQLLSDDNAVSPVIGVILMVAITVILAAVIGTFVLGLGEGVQNQSPQVTWDYEQSGSGGSITVTAAHTGGDSIDGDNLEIKSDCTSTNNPFSGSTVTAGNSGQIASSCSDGDVTRIVYNNPDSAKTSVIGKYEV